MNNCYDMIFKAIKGHEDEFKKEQINITKQLNKFFKDINHTSYNNSEEITMCFDNQEDLDKAVKMYEEI